MPGTGSSSTDWETARSSLPSSLVFALLVFVLSLEKNSASTENCQHPSFCYDRRLRKHVHLREYSLMSGN